jgi:hypothetical protein
MGVGGGREGHGMCLLNCVVYQAHLPHLDPALNPRPGQPSSSGGGAAAAGQNRFGKQALSGVRYGELVVKGLVARENHLDHRIFFYLDAIGSACRYCSFLKIFFPVFRIRNVYPGGSEFFHPGYRIQGSKDPGSGIRIRI